MPAFLPPVDSLAMVIRRGSPPRTKPRAVATVRPPVLGGSGGEQAEHGLVIKRGSHVRHPADGGKGLKYHKDMAMGDPLSTLLCDLPPWYWLQEQFCSVYTHLIIISGWRAIFSPLIRQLVEICAQYVTFRNFSHTILRFRFDSAVSLKYPIARSTLECMRDIKMHI